MRDTDDPFRTRTYATAAAAVAEATPGQLLAGRGLGAVWPWYAEDAERYNWTSSDTSMQFWYNTPWGSSMLHAHSLPLYLAIEVGVPGLLFTLALVLTLAALWWRARLQHWRAGVASGLVASFTAIAFDLPLFKSFTLSCLWWMFVLGLLMTEEDA
jgi:O-antigen ligase